MSEEKKGIISLRRKKTTVRPKISAPQQIISGPSTDNAAPIPNTLQWDAASHVQDGSDFASNTIKPITSRTSNDNANANPNNNSTNSTNSTSIASNTLAVPIPRPRPSISGGDRTADLVKRRYSTRFAQPQDNELAPPMPSIPGLPAQYPAAKPPSRDGRSPERRAGQPLTIDLKALRDPQLQPEQCAFLSPFVSESFLSLPSLFIHIHIDLDPCPDVAHILADATEDDIYNYQSELHKLKNRTSVDLQHNVYQNRNQFIKISKEADKLKSEMRTMRSLMSELTAVLGHAAEAGDAADNDAANPMNKRRNRSSVANLEALWSSHLQTLWKRVEGSQKFLPAIPGRHVLHESGRWVELNTATWKPRRRVHLILLNDHLLFASEKKRLDPNGMSPNPQNRRQSTYQPPTQTHLVAERCWPLQDVQISDISTRAGDSFARPSEKSHISNAVNVRVGSESWTFATTSAADSTAETSALLVAFRKAVEDLRKTMAAEHGDRERALDELAFLTGDSRLLKKANTTDDMDAGLMITSSTLIDVDGKQQSLRWVDSQIDGLDIDIALQHFDDAVARTEKLRRLARNIKGNAVAQEIINLKLDQRTSNLAAILGRRLRDGNSGATTVKENVGWLVRLGFEELARVGYLDVRKEVMRKRTRLALSHFLPLHYHLQTFIAKSRQQPADRHVDNSPLQAPYPHTLQPYLTSHSPSSLTPSLLFPLPFPHPPPPPSSNGPKIASTSSTLPLTDN